MLYDDDAQPWQRHARVWFDDFVDDDRSACFPVIEVEGEIIATAVGTLELGVPNPQCVSGRTARLANVITILEHRGHGHGTLLVNHVIEWANSINADRIDLSATPAGQ